MDYRQFNLMNDLGETYRLTIANKYGAGFAYDVKGLGAEESTTYQQIGTRFGLLTDKINQQKINGVISFFNPHAYENYVKFALFCQHKPLKLYYRTPAGEYWRDGIVTKIEKSESAESLKAVIEFTASGLWYRPFEVSGTNSVSIFSESANEAGLHIIIKGTMSTPQWSQSVDGTEILTGRLEDKVTATGNTISAAINTDYTLHIRTDTIPYRIYKVYDYTGEVTDMYINSDWSTERFCLLQHGDNVIQCASATRIRVEGREEYETI